MYAIAHAATALVLKKKEPEIPLIPLLISVQLVEILWVILTYLGIEYSEVVDGKFHLHFLPYSHSIFSGVVLGMIGFLTGKIIWKNNKMALFIALGIISHVVLDIIFHEQDIQLSPFKSIPVFGLNIISYPLLDFILEFLYCILCWWFYKGSKALLWVIIIFNVMNLPTMFAGPKMVNIISAHPPVLPTLILFQILATWAFVYFYSNRKPLVID